MFTKHDANGNAVFTYSEEIGGWFYDCVKVSCGTEFHTIIEDEGKFTTYSCKPDNLGGVDVYKVGEFTL